MSKLVLFHLLLLISLNNLCRGTNRTMSFEDNNSLFRIWDANNKSGFIDMNGNVTIRPQFDDVGEFSEGLAAFRIGDKWGFINRKGETVIPARWEHSVPRDNSGPLSKPISYSFSEGLAAVYVRDAAGVLGCGYVNTNGEYAIEPKIGRECRRFSDGLAAVQAGFNDSSRFAPALLWGFLDKKGNWAIGPQYHDAGDFLAGFALVQTKYVEKGNPGYSESLALIDKTGQISKDKESCRWKYQFSEGMAKISIGDWGEKGFQNYFINETCKKVLTFAPDIVIVSNFSDGLAPICRQTFDEKNNLKIACGYVDHAGKQVIPLTFSNAAPFSEGLAIVSEDDSTPYYIDTKGEIFLKPVKVDGKKTIWSWKTPAPFKNGLAFQILHDSPNVYGYMNKSGKYVWVSPNAVQHLDKRWFAENYIGGPKSE